MKRVPQGLGLLAHSMAAEVIRLWLKQKMPLTWTFSPYDCSIQDDPLSFASFRHVFFHEIKSETCAVHNPQE